MKIANINNISFGDIIKVQSNKRRKIDKILKNYPEKAVVFSPKNKLNIEYIFTGSDAEIYSNSRNEAWSKINFLTYCHNYNKQNMDKESQKIWDKHNEEVLDYIKEAERNGKVIDYTS